MSADQQSPLAACPRCGLPVLHVHTPPDSPPWRSYVCGSSTPPEDPPEWSDTCDVIADLRAELAVAHATIQELTDA